MHIVTNNEKRAVNLKKRKDGYMGEFEERKGTMMKLFYNLKKEEKIM